MRHDSTKRFRWTEADEALLRERYPHELTESLLSLFPGSTVGGIRTRAQGLGILKTDEFRKAYLKANMASARERIRDSTPWNKQERVTKLCETCGTVIELPLYMQTKTRFCSRACVHERSRQRTGPSHPLYRLVERYCEWCGLAFKTKPAKVKMGEAKFCSRSCHGSSTSHAIQRVSIVEQEFGKALGRAGLAPEIQVRVGRWTVDFLFPHQTLVVEFDGDYWHSLPDVSRRDKRKTKELESLGLRVLRIRESVYRAHPDDAVRLVRDALAQ